MLSLRTGVALAVAILPLAGGVTRAAGLTVVRDGTPATAPAGVELAVALELRNDGPEPWTRDAGWAVSHHTLTATGEVVRWDGPRTRMPSTVPVGGTVSLEARLDVPSAPGRYRVVWDVVQEHVRWVSAADETPFAGSPLDVRPGYAAAVTVDSPAWMAAGRRSMATAELRNLGAFAWRAGGDFALAYHWRRPDGTILVWDGERTSMPRDVPPGETVSVEAVVEAPPEAGRLLLEWDLVHEGVTWFSELEPGVPPAVPVLVVSSPSPAAAAGVIGAAAAVAVALVARSRRRDAPADLVWLATVSVAAPAWVLAVGSQRLSAAGWCLSLGVAGVLCAVLAPLPRRARGWAAWLAGTAVAVLAFGDAVHLRFFDDLPSAAAVGAAGQLDEIVASIVSLARPGDLWLAAVVACGAAVAALPPSAAAARRRPVRRAVLLLAASVVPLGAGVVLAVAGGGGVLGQVFRNLYLAGEVGVLPYHAVDAGRAALDRLRRRSLDDQRRAELWRWFDDQAPRRAGTGPAFGVARGLNLVMIQVESLQSFAVGMEAGGEPVMPTLSRWRREALYVPALTDQTAAGRSSDAELATQASLLPPDRGAAAFRHPSNGFTTIASILAERGYATLSAVPFDGGFWNRRVTHRSWGYRRTLFAGDFAPGREVGWGLNDRDFLLQAADRLAAEPQPFCAWLLTLSLHHPFEGFPADLEELDVGSHAGTPFGAYLHTMRLFDRALEGFVARLDQLGLGERTVIALWGDHDAGFEWTASFAGRLGVPHDAAGWYLSQTVPLLVRVPGAAGPAGEHALPAGQVDVAPTLLALLGVDPAGYAMLGRNLLGEPGDEPVVGEYRCWRDREHLFLQGGRGLEDGRCLDADTLEPLEVARCADGYRAAMTRVAVSNAVLAYDVQDDLRALLAAPGGARPPLDAGASATLR